MWERVSTRLERLGMEWGRREGPQEGLLPGARVCLRSVFIAPGAGGEWHLEGLSPLPGGRLGSWRRPLLSWQARQTPPTLNSLSHLPCPPCASHVGALGRTSCSPNSSSGAWVGRAGRVLWGGLGVIQRGKEKYHLIFCLPPHLSGPFQASVHGRPCCCQIWSKKNGEKSR